MSLKQQILQGVARTDTIHVPELASETFDGTVTIRPLTDAEQDEVTQKLTAGQVVRGKPGEQRPSESEVDVSKSAAGQAAARRLKAAYGMSVNGEKWTAAEVAALPPKAVKTIADAVDELGGGGGVEDDVRTFRSIPGGKDDRGAASDGAADSA